MSKPLILTQDVWAKIHRQIAKDYPPSVLLIRDRTKSVLGFTSRLHRYWKPAEGVGVYDGYGDYITEVHLDFYNEPKRTMFLLKYGNYMLDTIKE
jgi:hypothetical protein